MAFIWQERAWGSKLRWSDAAVLPAVASARGAQGHLLGRAEGLGLDLGREVGVTNLVIDAVKTAAVEGEQLDPKGVRSSVARQLGVPVAGHASVPREVDGLVEMLVDATGQADAALTAVRLHGWHAGLFPLGYSGIRRITVAGWREGSEPMRVISGRSTVHFEAPPSDAVAHEMEQFLAWWSGGPGMDGLIRAAVAHLWFLTIHPYDDGNGRMARAVSDMALAQDEGSAIRLYSMSAQIEAERAAYYEQLEAAQRGDGEITAWVVWFLEALRLAVRDAEQRIDAVLARGAFWQRQGGVPLSARQHKVVARLLEAGPGGFEGGLSTRKYAALTGVSRATAQREIADLLRKGLLVALAGGGRSTAYELVW